MTNTKLTPAQAKLYARILNNFTGAHRSTNSYVATGAETRSALALEAAGLIFKTGFRLYVLTADAWAEIRETAHADALRENADRYTAHSSTVAQWEQAHRMLARAGMGPWVKGMIARDHAEALAVEEAQAEADAAFTAPRPYPCSASETVHALALIENETFDDQRQRAEWCDRHGVTAGMYSLGWDLMRDADHTDAIRERLDRARQADNYMGTDEYHAAVEAAQAAGLFPKTKAEHRCQWNAPTDEEPDSEQCTDTAIEDETLCQEHADLNADLIDAYADSFAGYQS